MDNKLYEIVRKVIESSSREDARNLLFGTDGIQLNTHEHYNRLLSEFVFMGNLVFKETFDIEYLLNFTRSVEIELNILQENSITL